jgi:hypothetical protein
MIRWLIIPYIIGMDKKPPFLVNFLIVNQNFEEKKRTKDIRGLLYMKNGIFWWFYGIT